MREKTGEPEMQPWAEEKYEAAREGRAANEFGAKTWTPPSPVVCRRAPQT